MDGVERIMHYVNSIPLFTQPTQQPMLARWYQDEARASVFNYYATKDGNPVIVMPPGTGKSFCIADLITYTLLRWPHQRFIVLTHVKELIDQNVKTLRRVWPLAPVGVFSDGLGQRDTMQPIIFGGVSSVVSCIERFGHRDMLIVDEAHMIAPRENAEYQQIIAGLRKINPRMVIVGYTATEYRTGQGLLTEGDDRVFTDIAYDLSQIDRFNRLFDEGYLCRLIPKRMETQFDISGVSKVNGDFAKGELQDAVDKKDLTYRSCYEMVLQARDRHCWLVFSSGVKHSAHIAENLNQLGIHAIALDGKTKHRDDIIRDYRNGNVQSLVVYGIGTTGLDVPQIDYIGMLRFTMSVNLWIQMLGRGDRPLYAPGFDLATAEGRLQAIAASVKPNCLVSDFAQNTPRLGPFNDPQKPRAKGKGTTGDAPVKICDNCGTYNHTRAQFCVGCGKEFLFAPKLSAVAGDHELIRRVEPVYVTFDVQQVVYDLYIGKGATPGFRVEYFCGIKLIPEYFWPEAKEQFARKKFRDWWRRRSSVDPPETTTDALRLIAQLAKPKQIRVWTNVKYPEVVDCIF